MEVRFADNLQEVEEAYELASRIFGPTYYESRDRKQVIKNLEKLDSLSDVVIAIAEKQVIGLARILNRAVYVAGKIIPTGGVTSVCVHPAWRGQKVGLRLMSCVSERLKLRGDILAVLFARRAVDGWYSKMGYAGIGSHFEMTVNNLPQSYSGLDIALINGLQEGELKTYQSVYAASYQELFLSFARAPSWWNKFSLHLQHRLPSASLVNVIRESELVGYFIWDQGKVVELSAQIHRREIVLIALLKFIKSLAFNQLVLALPAQHWAAKYFQDWNHTSSFRFSWDGGHMACLLSFPELQNIVGIKDAPMKNHSGDLCSPINMWQKVSQLCHPQSIDWRLTMPTWSPLDEF
jgi:predicted N-acetyltransferase YhbS